MALPDTTVKYFDNTMSGAPTLAGNSAGHMISILDACLQNGFGSVTLTSLVVASNVATATVSGGHGFSMIFGGSTGPVVTIAGATPSSLNGEWRIASVPNSTTFTFATEGISDQTATGTITAKRSPAGWTKVYSGTNKAAYRANSVLGARLFLRVADEGTGSTAYCRVRGYETMTDVDSGTGLFPTDAQVNGGLYWSKSYDTSGTLRGWKVIADHRCLYYINELLSYYKNPVCFGDFISEKSGDSYNVIIVGGTGSQLGLMGPLCEIPADTTIGNYIARSYTTTVGSIGCAKTSHRASGNYMGYGGMTYPSAISNKFYIAPVEIWEGSLSLLRGIHPGLYNPLHPGSSLTEAIQSNITELPNRDILVVKPIYNSYAIAVNITGPWW